MDNNRNNKAEFLAEKGFDLYMEGKNFDAKNKFIDALELTDSDYWGLTDIHCNFGIVLRELGEISESTEQFKLALSSAMNVHDKESSTVSLARYALAEHFIGIGKFKKSLDVIEPAMELNCEQKWTLYYIGALAYCKLGEHDKCNEFASQVILLAPKGKYSGLDDLLVELKSKKF